MGLPLDVQVQRKRLDVAVRIEAVSCSCMVIHHANPSPAVHPCALDVAPPRYPTRVGKKRCASGLLGPRGAVGTSVGERRWLPNGVGLTLAAVGSHNRPIINCQLDPKGEEAIILYTHMHFTTNKYHLYHSDYILQEL